EAQEESRRSDHQQVDGDAHHDLIGTKADRAHAVHEREGGAARDTGEHTEPRTVAVIAAEGGGEGSAEHITLQPQPDESRALGCKPPTSATAMPRKPAPPAKPSS